MNPTPKILPVTATILRILNEINQLVIQCDANPLLAYQLCEARFHIRSAHLLTDDDDYDDED